jgi:head-tail adaptor
MAAGAGALRDVVDVERLTMVSDDEGGQVEEWAPLLTGYAAKVTPGGAASVERVYGDTRVEAPGVSEVLMRMPASVELKASDRIRYRGRALAIRGLEDIDNARRYLRLFCVEDVA